MNRNISPRELAERLREENAPRLVDVRERDEFQIAALPGAKLIPLGEIAERLDELDAWRDDEIVVYCHHGFRSQRAIAQLRSRGFEHLANLTGGIDRWAADVDPALPRY